MTPTGLEQRVRGILARIGVRGADEVPGGASLNDAGLVDSFLLLELIAALEEELGIAIHNREVVPENLDSVDALVAFAASKGAG